MEEIVIKRLLLSPACSVWLRAKHFWAQKFWRFRSSGLLWCSELTGRTQEWQWQEFSPDKCERLSPCAAAWAWSPWWTHIYRARSSGCRSSWSTAADRTGAQSAGFLCSGMAWSGDPRPLHSGKSCGSRGTESVLGGMGRREEEREREMLPGHKSKPVWR